LARFRLRTFGNNSRRVGITWALLF
jgi:hypothetical protein